MRAIISLLSIGLTFCIQAATIEIKVITLNQLPLEAAVVSVNPATLPQRTDDKQVTQIKSTTPYTLVLKQQDKKFTPYISVVAMGSQVKFVNQDAISHHVYSLTGVQDMSFIIRANSEQTLSGFAKTGVVAMGCNIHDWMSGYIKVVDSPFYTQTDTSGVAVLTLPDDYKNIELDIWHPQLNEQLSVIANAGDSLTLTLKEPMSEIPTQKAPQDIDFMGTY